MLRCASVSPSLPFLIRRQAEEKHPEERGPRRDGRGASAPQDLEDELP